MHSKDVEINRALQSRNIAFGRSVLTIDFGGDRGDLVNSAGIHDDAGELLCPQPEHGVVSYDLLADGDDPMRGDDAEYAMLSSLLDAEAETVIALFPPGGLAALAKLERYGTYPFRREIQASNFEHIVVCGINPNSQLSMAAVEKVHELYPDAAILTMLNEMLGSADPTDSDFDYFDYLGDELYRKHPHSAKVLIDSLGRRGANLVLPRCNKRALSLATDHHHPFMSDEFPTKMTSEMQSRFRRWRIAILHAMRPYDHFFGLVESMHGLHVDFADAGLEKMWKIYGDYLSIMLNGEMTEADRENFENLCFAMGEKTYGPISPDRKVLVVARAKIEDAPDNASPQDAPPEDDGYLPIEAYPPEDFTPGQSIVSVPTGGGGESLAMRRGAGPAKHFSGTGEELGAQIAKLRRTGNSDMTDIFGEKFTVRPANSARSSSRNFTGERSM